MSTNFYFEFKLGDSRNGTVAIYKMHIGKATRSLPPGAAEGETVYGISTFSGKHFPDVESWIKFLRHNTDCGEIVDEYGQHISTEKFIADYLDSDLPTSASAIQWMRDNFDDPSRNLGGETLKIWDEPQPDAWRSRYWIDPTGKLFCGGEFF